METGEVFKEVARERSVVSSKRVWMLNIQTITLIYMELVVPNDGVSTDMHFFI